MPKLPPKDNRASSDPTLVTSEFLHSWPLPQPDEQGDKNERGQVLLVGGANEMPGALILAATAALRAGAGKLQAATGRSIHSLVGCAVPEARVFGWAETAQGGIDPDAAELLARQAEHAQATLIGPGMLDEQAVQQLLTRLTTLLQPTTLVLDATALVGTTETIKTLASQGHQIIVLPHAGEMATMRSIDKATVEADPATIAREAAAAWGIVVALKGADTYLAAPDGALYCYQGGTVGLATSGSGDTLAGIATGLAARGASPIQAAVWAVYLHGSAGSRIVARRGKLGLLARELLDEIPALMAEFDER